MPQFLPYLTGAVWINLFFATDKVLGFMMGVEFGENPGERRDKTANAQSPHREKIMAASQLEKLMSKVICCLLVVTL